MLTNKIKNFNQEFRVNQEALEEELVKVISEQDETTFEKVTDVLGAQFLLTETLTYNKEKGFVPILSNGFAVLNTDVGELVVAIELQDDTYEWDPGSLEKLSDKCYDQVITLMLQHSQSLLDNKN